MEQIMRAVAERKIQEAIDEGVFDNLPGKGEPLKLDDDPFTPPHLRLANRILKNAGVLPDWLQLEKEIEAARQDCSRMVSELEAAYPKRLASLDTAESKHRFALWLARARAEYLSSIKRVNLEIAKLSLIAPSIERPLIPYQIREETRRFDERFPSIEGIDDAVIEESPAPVSKLRTAAVDAYRIRSRRT